MDGDPTFGVIVKERRVLLGLTQTELARRVACAPVTVRKIEYDALRPSVQIAERLAAALNIPEEDQLAFIRLARPQRQLCLRWRRPAPAQNRRWGQDPLPGGHLREE